MIFELHGAQVEAILLFDQWMDEHYRGPDPDVLARVRDIIEQSLAFDAELGGLLGMSELFLTGGRRSGKTFLMEAILCSYAVAVPESIVWTVVPSEKFIEEPRKVIADSILPSAWYEYNGSPQFTFYLVNGSQHVLLSGHKPSNLKKGKAALVGLNEAQQIRSESYRNARRATVDAGGFSIVAANPPITGDIGTWVLDAATAIEMNDRPAAEHVFVDPLLNPHVDPRKLLALKSSMALASSSHRCPAPPPAASVRHVNIAGAAVAGVGLVTVARVAPRRPRCRRNATALPPAVATLANWHATRGALRRLSGAA